MIISLCNDNRFDNSLKIIVINFSSLKDTQNYNIKKYRGANLFGGWLNVSFNVKQPQLIIIVGNIK